MKNGKLNTKAIAALNAELVKAKEAVKEIAEAIEAQSNTDPANIHFGHVGDAAYLTETLTHMTDRLYQRGEYAECNRAR